MLIRAVMGPIIIILLLLLIFPLIANLVYNRTGFLLDNYYTIIAITMVSFIPLFFGVVYSFMLLNENDSNIFKVIITIPDGKKNLLFMRMFVQAFLSFILVSLIIIMTNPVPFEGWLRTIYASVLLSVQAPFIFLFIGSLANNKIEGIALSVLCGMFLAAVPFGLMVHHPWNYFVFFSPLYWTSWAWVTSVAEESIIYGAISLLITFGGILVFARHYLKKYSYRDLTKA